MFTVGGGYSYGFMGVRGTRARRTALPPTREGRAREVAVPSQQDTQTSSQLRGRGGRGEEIQNIHQANDQGSRHI